MVTSVKDLRSKAELDGALKEGANVILHFWAAWCQASVQMDTVFSQLCTDTPHAGFYRVEAEEQPEISEIYGVPAVPLFVFLKDGTVVDKLEGANPAELANKVTHLAGPPSLVKTPAPASLGMAAGATVLETVKDFVKQNGGVQNDMTDSSLIDVIKVRIQQLLDANSVILFMKGTPEQPRCGFSRKVVEALNEVGVKFGSFDILSDEDIRQGLKYFSNWPTYPQLYCKGELLGGCDITLEMHKSGELQEIFIEKGVLSSAKTAADKVTGDIAGLHKSTIVVASEPEVEVVAQQPEGKSLVANGNSEAGLSGVSEALKTRIEGLINSKPVLLFMKGTQEEPRCGFSKRVVEALKEEGVEFSSFDILSDDDVRQGLKLFSNWPTYPQLYIKGELIGGCDIVTDMHKSGDLKLVLTEKGVFTSESTEISKETIENRLKKLIESSPTMLFMKGTPDVPRCKFSTKVVNALKEDGATFGSFDILSNDEVRQGLKTYSNWPTFPQLYHNGELIGGCDIVLDMQKSGELKTVLFS